jgi:hypothetical protein
MSYTTAFLQNGETREITAADTPPEAVQIPANFTVGARQRNQFRVVNSSDENIAFLGAGPTAALAATNSAVVSTTGNSIPLLPGSVEILSFPPDWYFTLSTVSSTAVIYITPGEGL